MIFFSINNSGRDVHCAFWASRSKISLFRPCRLNSVCFDFLDLSRVMFWFSRPKSAQFCSTLAKFVLTVSNKFRFVSTSNLYMLSKNKLYNLCFSGKVSVYAFQDDFLQYEINRVYWKFQCFVYWTVFELTFSVLWISAFQFVENVQTLAARTEGPWTLIGYNGFPREK